MENAVFIGLSQQMALKRRLDMTANNLANVNTTAFKSEHPLFEEFLVERANQDDVSYVQDYGSYRDLREGEFTHTGRPLDLAISGEGYFSIETEDGIRYTRNGSFRLDPDGNVVTINNEALLDENNRKITVDLQFQEVSIAPDGTVTTAPGQTAKIGLVKFENPQILKQVGNGLYDAEDFQPEAAIDVNIMLDYQSVLLLLVSEHELHMKSIEEMPTLQ